MKRLYRICMTLILTSMLIAIIMLAVRNDSPMAFEDLMMNLARGIILAFIVLVLMLIVHVFTKRVS